MKTMKRKTQDGRPVMLREFSGLKDLTTFLETTPPDDGWSNHADDSYPFNVRWCGAKNYTEAKASLTKGVNVTEIKKAISRGAGATAKMKRTQAVIGGCPNIPAFLAGNPACMYRIDRVKSRGAYNIFVDVGVHSGITKQQICDAGIEILIKVLQLASKYPVNLYVGDFGIHDKKIYGHAVKIIDAGRAYNTARVSYALTDAGFLRIFGLGVIERSGQYWSVGASYGYGRPLRSWERREAVEAVFKNAISLSTSEAIGNPTGAFKAIDDVLNRRR